MTVRRLVAIAALTLTAPYIAMWAAHGLDLATGWYWKERLR